MFARIFKKDVVEALEKRVEALEKAENTRTKEREKQDEYDAEMTRQMDNFWTYTGESQEKTK